MTERKRKRINCAVTVIEALLICVDSSGGFWLLIVFMLGNALYFGIRNIKATMIFTDRLGEKGFPLSLWRQRKNLSEEEQRAIREAMSYGKTLFKMAIVLILVYFVKGFF